jgi:hypothetical protein
LKKLLLLLVLVSLFSCSNDWAPYDNEFYYYNPDKPDYVFKTETLSFSEFQKNPLINGDYVDIHMEYKPKSAVVTFKTQKPFDIIWFGGYLYNNGAEKLIWDQQGFKNGYHYVSKELPYSKLDEPDCDNGYYHFMLSQKRY